MKSAGGYSNSKNKLQAYHTNECVTWIIVNKRRPQKFYIERMWYLLVRCYLHGVILLTFGFYVSKKLSRFQLFKKKRHRDKEIIKISKICWDMSDHSQVIFDREQKNEY